MSRNVAVRIVILCQAGLIVYTLYAILTGPGFPWVLTIATVVVSSILMFLLRGILHGDTSSGEVATPATRSNILHHGVWILVGSVFGLVGGILYSHLTHRAIRWEAYVGMLVPMSLFAVALLALRLHQRRRRTHS